MAVSYFQMIRRKQKEKVKAASIKNRRLWRTWRRWMDYSFNFSVLLKFLKSKNKHLRRKDSLKGVEWLHIHPNFSRAFLWEGMEASSILSQSLGLQALASPRLVVCGPFAVPPSFPRFMLGTPLDFEKVSPPRELYDEWPLYWRSGDRGGGEGRKVRT